MVDNRSADGDALVWADPDTLMHLLGRVAAERSPRDSSLPMDEARELMRSIGYTLSAYAKRHGATGSPFEALTEGRKVLSRRVALARTLYSRVASAAPPAVSRAYKNTLNSINKGFSKYDIAFHAHEFPASITYPVSAPVEDSFEGIDYVSEYLSRLNTENRFIALFSPEEVTLLARATEGFDTRPVNLYDAAVVHSLSRALVSLDEKGLIMPESSLPALEDRLATHLRGEPERCADALLDALTVSGDAARGYYMAAAQKIWPRLVVAAREGDLPSVFTSVQRPVDA